MKDELLESEPSPTVDGLTPSAQAETEPLPVRTAVRVRRAVVAVALIAGLLAYLVGLHLPGDAPEVVIKAQLKAFNQNDYARARFYASSDFKQIPLEDFRSMIREDYPQFDKSKAATCGRPEITGSNALVPATIVGRDGVVVHARYFMNHENGRWKISGVETDQSPTAKRERIL